jgi:cysteine-rich repeat protein
VPDCDDTDPWTHPLATDAYVDGLDANCDGIDGPVAVTPVQEQCGNGIDDDGNGVADCADSACALQCSTDPQYVCDNASLISEGTYGFDFVNTADAVSSCAAEERVLRFDAIEAGELSITLSDPHYVTPFTTCARDSGTCELAGIFVPMRVPVEPGSTYLAIETTYTVPSTFSVTVSFAPYVCGDSVLTGGEECDDGNTLVGDGCDAACAIEPFYATCLAAPELLEGTTVVDFLTMGTNQVEGSCGEYFGAPEYLYVFNPPANGTLSVALENAGPAVLFVRDICSVEPFDLGCGLVEDASPAVLHVPATLGTPLYVFVDGGGLAAGEPTLTTLFNAH